MTEPKQPKKYYIRFSNANDYDKIMEFYNDNAHKNVRKRQQDLMKQLAEDGAIVLIEDDKGAIVASSITYPHKVTDKNGIEHVQWQEIGTTRHLLHGFSGLFLGFVALRNGPPFVI